MLNEGPEKIDQSQPSVAQSISLSSSQSQPASSQCSDNNDSHKRRRIVSPV